MSQTRRLYGDGRKAEAGKSPGLADESATGSANPWSARTGTVMPAVRGARLLFSFTRAREYQIVLSFANRLSAMGPAGARHQGEGAGLECGQARASD